MKLTIQLALVALLAMMSASYLAHANAAFNKERKLCKNIEIQKVICHRLRAEAEKGGDRAAIFASKSKKACDKADKLAAIRWRYIERKGLSSAQECVSEEGKTLGTYYVEEILKNNINFGIFPVSRESNSEPDLEF